MAKETRGALKVFSGALCRTIEFLHMNSGTPYSCYFTFCREIVTLQRANISSTIASDSLGKDRTRVWKSGVWILLATYKSKFWHYKELAERALKCTGRHGAVMNVTHLTALKHGLKLMSVCCILHLSLKAIY